MHLVKNFRALEEAGVDQMILLQQSGNYRHEHICESMELFAKEVLPQFKEREANLEVWFEPCGNESGTVDLFGEVS